MPDILRYAASRLILVGDLTGRLSCAHMLGTVRRCQVRRSGPSATNRKRGLRLQRDVGVYMTTVDHFQNPTWVAMSEIKVRGPSNE